MSRWTTCIKCAIIKHIFVAPQTQDTLIGKIPSNPLPLKHGIYQVLVNNTIFNTVLDKNMQNYTILYTNTKKKKKLVQVLNNTKQLFSKQIL